MTTPNNNAPQAALDLRSYLTITFPDKTLELLCPPRPALKQLRSLFVELQALWVGHGFSTADLIADDAAWKLMEQIAGLFPQKANPAILGFDLELLQTDPGQLEQLFLTQDRGEIYAYQNGDTMYFNFFIDVFRGCKILEFCRFEPRLILQAGHKAWLEDQAETAAPTPETTAETTEKRRKRAA